MEDARHLKGQREARERTTQLCQMKQVQQIKSVQSGASPRRRRRRGGKDCCVVAAGERGGERVKRASHAKGICKWCLFSSLCLTGTREKTSPLLRIERAEEMDIGVDKETGKNTGHTATDVH